MKEVLEKMFNHQYAIWLLISTLALSNIGAGACDTAQRRESNAKTTPTPTAPAPTPAASPTPATAPANGAEKPADDAIKVLAQGGHASISESFIIIGRDMEIYAALRKLNAQLPELNADYFKTNTVIAVFLGQRRTGGYSVELKRDEKFGVRVAEQAPAKGTLTAQMITAPFKIVSVPLQPNERVQLALDPTWQNRLRPYRLASGNVTVSGGIAGRTEQAQLEGTFGVMREGKFATFIFDVRITGATKARTLQDAATGIVETDGRITIPRLDSFSLTGAIESPFRATGQFAANEDKLTLNFETVPAPNISDNFNGKGKLEANATAPAPARKARLEDEPM